MPSTKQTLPNFFLVGAPKAGTTAMCEYLRRHPHVFFSEPKEPLFWADELAGLRRQLGIDTIDAYLRLFRNAPAEARILGDGSTLHLMSPTAIGRILEFNPEAKFLVMLRHPVELAHSFHGQLCRTLNEDCLSFEQAWDLQDERRAGRCLPKRCVEPGMLQYREVAGLGVQLQRAQQLIPRAQLLVAFHQDFCESPHVVYRQVLDFLELPEDGRDEFPRFNASSQYRSQFAANILESSAVRRFVHSLKRHFPTRVVDGLRAAKEASCFRPAERNALSSAFRARLLEEFSHELELLHELTGRRLERQSRKSQISSTLL